jgi:hypothetical protein
MSISTCDDLRSPIVRYINHSLVLLFLSYTRKHGGTRAMRRAIYRCSFAANKLALPLWSLTPSDQRRLFKECHRQGIACADLLLVLGGSFLTYLGNSNGSRISACLNARVARRLHRLGDYAIAIIDRQDPA